MILLRLLVREILVHGIDFLLVHPTSGHVNHTTNAITGLRDFYQTQRNAPDENTHMHIMETCIDLGQDAMVGDILVNLNLAPKIVCRGYEYFKDTKAFQFPPSTRPGISVLPLTPPKALPRQVRPVTSWKLRSHVRRIHKDINN